ncbi:MAG: hypothetical protein Q9216_002379, partial [Gyalolechia sp. 2 TL-2023]
RYDTSYDLRDRTRTYRALLADPSSTQLASLLLLAPKPVPHAPSPSEYRKGLPLGSASLVLGTKFGGGESELPEWVKEGEEPDSSVRDDGAGTEVAAGLGGGGGERPAGEALDAALREERQRQREREKEKGKGKVVEKNLEDWLGEGEEESGSEEEEDEEETEEGEGESSEYEEITESEGEGDEEKKLSRSALSAPPRASLRVPRLQPPMNDTEILALLLILNMLIHLLRSLGQLQFRSTIPRRLDGEPQILPHQPDREAAFEVLFRRSTRTDALDWVVDRTGPALSTTTINKIGQLCGSAVAVVIVGGAAEHECEGGGAGTNYAAGHRSVDEDAGGRGVNSVGDISGGSGIDGGAVDEEARIGFGVGIKSAEELKGSQLRSFVIGNMLIIRDWRNIRARPSSTYRFLGNLPTGGSNSNFFLEFPGGLTILVVDDQGVAFRDLGSQILGHGVACSGIAHCDAVEEKLLRAVVGMELGSPPLPSMHKFEGENRMEMAAFMITTMQTGYDKGGVGEVEGGRGREHARGKGDSRQMKRLVLKCDPSPASPVPPDPEGSGMVGEGEGAMGRAEQPPAWWEEVK